MAAIEVIGDSVVIRLQGRLDLRVRREIHAAIDTATKDCTATEVRVDFGAAEHLDSTVLGLLLILREEALARNKRVSLINCHGNVKAVLDIAHFEELFPINQTSAPNEQTPPLPA